MQDVASARWPSLETKIREFVAELALQDAGAPIDDLTELLQSGILTSLSLISILAMIEKETGARIVTDETGIDDFSTLEKILKRARASFEHAI